MMDQQLLRNMAASWASELSLLSSLALRNWYAVTRLLRSDLAKKKSWLVLFFDHHVFFFMPAE